MTLIKPKTQAECERFQKYERDVTYQTRVKFITFPNLENWLALKRFWRSRGRFFFSRWRYKGSKFDSIPYKPFKNLFWFLRFGTSSKLERFIWGSFKLSSFMFRLGITIRGKHVQLTPRNLCLSKPGITPSPKIFYSFIFFIFYFTDLFIYFCSPLLFKPFSTYFFFNPL